MDDTESMLGLGHTHIFDLRAFPFENKNLFKKVAWEKEWNHVEVTNQSVLDDEEEGSKAIGIHIVREEGSMEEDIRFDDPYLSSSASEKKRKSDSITNTEAAEHEKGCKIAENEVQTARAKRRVTKPAYLRDYV